MKVIDVKNDSKHVKDQGRVTVSARKDIGITITQWANTMNYDKEKMSELLEIVWELMPGAFRGVLVKVKEAELQALKESNDREMPASVLRGKI